MEVPSALILPGMAMPSRRDPGRKGQSSWSVQAAPSSAIASRSARSTRLRIVSRSPHGWCPQSALPTRHDPGSWQKQKPLEV